MTTSATAATPVVTITVQGSQYQLGRRAPTLDTLVPITAGDHYRYFYAFDTSDVWTADGWLVTAVQNDGVTHHVRKGDQVGRVIIEPGTALYYKPTPKSKYYMDQVAAAQ